MEKLIYPLWSAEAQSVESMRDNLLDELVQWVGPADCNVCAARLAVADRDVTAAAQRVLASGGEPLPDGLLSLWVHQSVDREVMERKLQSLVGRSATYLVVESEPLVNTRHTTLPGERLHGMCQVVFLQRPPRLSEAEWLRLWQACHTQVAIDTQGTFAYRQNVVVRPLSQGAANISAVVEENFPPQAMGSDYAFYGVSDDQALAANRRAMMESCARFIDFDKIDVIPMSEYPIGAIMAAPL